MPRENQEGSVKAYFLFVIPVIGILYWNAVGCTEPKGAKEVKFYTLFPTSQTEFNEIETLLAHGMIGHAPKQDGEFQLERTGPFIPKISMPGLGEMIVTEQGKTELEELGFEGVTFKQVHPLKVVQLNWDPDISKPDDWWNQDFVDLIESRPNSDEAAKAIGPLYLVVTDVGASFSRMEQIGMLNPHFQLVFDASSWNGQEFFCVGRSGSSAGFLVVTEEGRKKISQVCGKWIKFHEAKAE